MGNGRCPGPQCQVSRAVKIDAGTLNRNATLSPGPLGRVENSTRFFMPYVIKPRLLFVCFRKMELTTPTGPHKAVVSRLGVNPDNYLVNVMELHFYVDSAKLWQHLHVLRIPDSQKVRARIQYRFNRVIKEDMWVETPTGWHQTSLSRTAKWHSDTPHLPKHCCQPPDLYSFDRPGWAFSKIGSTSELVVDDQGTKTDASVSAIVWIQNFREWVEAAAPNDGWRNVSDVVEWYSRQWAYRAAAGKPWQSRVTRDGADIGLGHVPMKRPR